MIISTQTRYAVRFLLELSKSEDQDKPVTLRNLASKQGISEAYMESIAAKLRKNGYIKGFKGAGGGYLLMKNLDDITVGEIMKLMESTYFKVHCVDDAQHTCKNYQTCAIAKAWEQLEFKIDEVVDTLKLSQFSEDWV